MNFSKGRSYEEEVVEYLLRRGYEILARNWHGGKHGEIDIVAIEPNWIVFVEVKGRSASIADALESIDKSKANKLINTIDMFMLEHKDNIPPNYKTRFDVVLIYDNQIEQIKNVDICSFCE